MSLQIAAQHLASKGRNGDSMLVHMTPGEVGGLQTLAMAHGGSLTINPDTGLPEANFLKAILPTLLGAGLTFFSGGVINPLMAGAIVGGGTALATKDLGQGLMAGLGAYTGGGLGGAFTGATSMGAQAAAQQATGQTIAEDAAKNAALEGFTLPSDYASLAGRTAPAQQVASLGQSGIDQFTSQGFADQAKQSFGQLTQPGGFSNLTGSFAQTFKSPLERTAATMGATNALSSLTAPPAMPMAPTDGKFKYEGPYTPPEREVVFPTGPRDETSEFLYFRPTNPVPGAVAYAAEGGPIYSPDANMNYDEGFAIGGLTALAGGGRFLQGPGDGTSDSIPAVIGNKQPARLADGEFVVDARTVSELGNGSSKAGAQKLYKMMDRIHGARKTAKRGKDSNAEKYLPA